MCQWTWSKQHSCDGDHQKTVAVYFMMVTMSEATAVTCTDVSDRTTSSMTRPTMSKSSAVVVPTTSSRSDGQTTHKSTLTRSTSTIGGKSGSSASTMTATTYRESVGSIREAMVAYVYCYRNGTVATEMLTETVNMWIASFGTGSAVNSAAAAAAAAAASSSADSSIGVINCPICRCFIHEPVTLSACGHTYCKRCLIKSDSRQCTKCRAAILRDRSTSLSTMYHVSVVAANILAKWWPKDSEAARLKHLGNELFEGKDLTRAIQKYNEAYELDHNDAVLLSNRSYALLNIGKSAEALVDAEATVNVRPDWSKGYFRKGSAFVSLGRYEDAAVAYLQCLVLEPNNPTVVIEAVKVLHKCLTMLNTARPTLSRPEIGSAACRNRTKSSSIHGWESHHEDDMEKYDSSERSNKRLKLASTVDVSLSTKEGEKLSRFLDRCHYEMDRTKKMASRILDRPVDEMAIDKSDFECTLCYRLFWEPVTTPCGHVFCRSCLDRCLDHFARCPLCKTSLEDYLAQRRTVVTELLDAVMKKYIPGDYAERHKDHEEEMDELMRVGHGEHSEIPIFVCTVGFPTIPCPLHVFEPKYRLMVRRCMEAGIQQFGMCTALDGATEEFANYGTVLEVRNAQYFPDGRSVLNTIGRGRFHVLQRGVKDGYHTAKVESLRDRPDDDNDIHLLHDAVLRQVTSWFGSLSTQIRNRIVQHFGSMPAVENDYVGSPDGPAWTWWTLAILPLDQRAQLAILATKSLKKRLEALRRTLNHITITTQPGS